MLPEADTICKEAPRNEVKLNLWGWVNPMLGHW